MAAIQGKIPPRKGKPFQYPTLRVVNPGKGLNVLASNEFIDDHEASDLNNVVISELGTVTKSPGVTSWGVSLANKPRGLGSFNTAVSLAAGSHYVLTMDGSSLKYSTSASDSWHAIAGVTFTANLDTTFTQLRTTTAAASSSSGASISYSQGTDAIFVWNGTDPGSYWDGTTLHRPGTIPNASFSIYYAGYHIAAGTSSNPNRLYISDANDATAFTTHNWASPGTPKDPPQGDNPTDVPDTTAASGVPVAIGAQLIDIQPRDGDVITGLGKFSGALIIFKSRAIYQMTFDPTTGTPTIVPIITYLGAVSHRSIDNIDNDLFYLSTLGWFTIGYQESFYNIIRTNELSQRIHPLVQTINPANLGRVSSIYQPYRFYSSFASGGSTMNNTTVVYDKRYDAWTKMDYVTAESFTVYYDGTNTQHLLWTDDTSANVWELKDNVYSNNGNAIDSYWQSKAFDGGQPDLYKRWIDVTLYFRQISGNIVVTIYTDGQVLAHTSYIAGGNAAFNGGIAATGSFGTELWGGNSNQNTVGDPFPSNGSVSPSTAINVPYRIKISQKSRTLMVKIEEPTDVTGTFAFLGLALTYQPYSHFVFSSNLLVQ